MINAIISIGLAAFISAGVALDEVPRDDDKKEPALHPREYIAVTAATSG